MAILAFNEAVNSVASGKYDIVMCAGLETPKKHLMPGINLLICYSQSRNTTAGGHQDVHCLTRTTAFDGVSDNLLTEEQGKTH